MAIFTNFKAQKALMLHSKGKYDEAKTIYDEAYAQGMNTARYLLPYSILLLRLGDYEKAREVLKKAEKAPGGLTPDQRSQMLTNYAIVSWKTGRIDYAIDLLREVYRKGVNGTIYGTLGFLLIEKGDFEEALAFNQEALEYDDEDAVVLDNLAQTYYRLGNDKAEARKWFKKALEQKESAIDTNYFLALYDIEDGDMDAAREKLETAKAGRFSPLNYATPALIEEALGRLQ
ncbi:MAG: tetratricopeptide repeat protein [Oscillospiraceae bacterium]|jgi:tetratricopeptide (TPR) repeat protein|nr:tetratricopeptide repeat protein [Oscillospiraceae bacterium]